MERDQAEWLWRKATESADFKLLAEFYIKALPANPWAPMVENPTLEEMDRLADLRREFIAGFLREMADAILPVEEEPQVCFACQDRGPWHYHEDGHAYITCHQCKERTRVCLAFDYREVTEGPLCLECLANLISGKGGA